MKSTLLAVTILFSLAGPASLLAAEAVPVDVAPAAQQVVAETVMEVDAAVTELKEQQAVAETLPEVAAPAAALVEPQVAAEAPAAAAAPATDRVEAQTAPETPAEVVTAGAGASGTATPRVPCPMHGKGLQHRGMGKDGKGPGGGKPGCDHRGKGQHNKHEQVVRRLDMIEARMAKIEAMLERLMQR